MNQAEKQKLRRRLRQGSYSATQIKLGIDQAEAADAETLDEALSIALSRILYTKAECLDGCRFPVEPGSVNWDRV